MTLVAVLAFCSALVGAAPSGGIAPTEEARRHQTISFDEVGVGQALSSESRDAAAARAREDALGKAMMGASDVFYGFSDTSLESGRKRREAVSKFLFTSSRGVLKDVETGAPECELNERVTTCRVRVRGNIALRGNVDPSFLILDKDSGKPMGLDRRQYYDDEDVSLSLAVTAESYIYVFSWDENDDLYLVFPDRPGRSHTLNAGESLTLPAAGSGVKFRAVLPPGKSKAAERLLIIASRKPFMAPLPAAKGKDIAAHKAGSLTDIMRRLAQLERSEWTVEVLFYDIVGR
jgi:hypothetical protein